MFPDKSKQAIEQIKVAKQDKLFLKNYKNLAIQLATNPKKLSQLKKKLAINKKDFPLFNTEKTVHHLEKAYQKIWERHINGQTPTSITILPD